MTDHPQKPDAARREMDTRRRDENAEIASKLSDQEQDVDALIFLVNQAFWAIVKQKYGVQRKYEGRQKYLSLLHGEVRTPLETLKKAMKRLRVALAAYNPESTRPNAKPEPAEEPDVEDDEPEDKARESEPDKKNPAADGGW